MNIETIDKEIEHFTQLFFHDIAQRLEYNVALIEKYSLIVPRENYTLISDFLATTFKKFYSFDPNFKTPFLEKLYNDVTSLEKMLRSITYSKNDIKQIFETKFLSSSTSITEFREELNLLKHDYSTQVQEIHSRLQRDINKLIAIYKERFEEIFHEEYEYFYTTLLSVLNSRTYYLDKVMWIEANASMSIHKHLPENIYNTRDYLHYVMGVIHPYSEKYKTYELALRIYK